MKTLTWDNTLSVEVPEIDEDHRRLVDLYNLLSQAVAGRESADYIDALTEELVACTVWHFRHEERLMLKHGYDGLEAHRNEHEELISSVRSLQQRLQAQDQAVGNDEIEYLEHWLMEHIFGADMKMGAYLGEVM
jgi:hemerythrin-like metal-binding protein